MTSVSVTGSDSTSRWGHFRGQGQRLKAVLGNAAEGLLVGQHAEPELDAADKLRELALDIDATERALALLATPLAEARKAASIPVCDSIRTDHDAIIAEALAATASLFVAVKRYRALNAAIGASGIDPASLRQLPLGGLIGGPGCVLKDFVERARSAGADIPRELAELM